MNANRIIEMLNCVSVSRKSKRVPKKNYNSPVYQENYAKQLAACKVLAKEKKVSYKKLMNAEKRKQVKVRRDTWRRVDVPSDEEDRLNDMHYANFLGDKYGDNGSPYNNALPINLKYCDSMCMKK
jgi:hypothetical protein